MKKNKNFFALLIATICAGPAGAQEAPDPDAAHLMALLAEETAIATRTRMNADWVPGMVTVLRGDDLEARGARTVWEALALVPGMELAIEKTGRRKVLVRGLGNIWASGNVKILLNDVSMNSAEFGLADPVFNIPVEQVERIEIIRGPGSAIYGEFAYMGVINVVTHAEENRVFALGGSFNTAGAGATLVFTNPKNPIQASLNLGAWRSSGADAQTGPDKHYVIGTPQLSHAPGPANEEMDAATAVFKLAQKDFSLSAQWSQDGLGDYFGINHYLPPDPDEIVERNRHRAVEMREEIPLTPALTAGIQLGWKDVQRLREDLYVRANEPLFLDSRSLETTMHLGTDLTYRSWPKHVVLLAADISQTRVDEDEITFNPPIATAITVPAGTERSIHAVTLQEEYRHSDLFTLTAGVRYDEYSDVGTHYSPRVAGVWRLNDGHILKAQYAEAFRPPTLYEIASADYWYNVAVAAGVPPEDRPAKEVKPATIRTTELGYIFKGDQAETRLTGFYSQLDDIVVYVRDTSLLAIGFASQGAATWGVELEQSWRASPQWTVDGNLSFVDTRDKGSSQSFPGAARWLANAAIAYEQGDFLGMLQAHYVSGYTREPEDSRSSLGGYTTVDLTGTYSRVFTKGLQARVGIKNLFDADVRYPSPVFLDSDGVVKPFYPDDLPRAGRSWWVQLGYRY